ncbi:MAG: PAS domain-containing protein [Candidatus Omnitrophota bacterium]
MFDLNGVDGVDPNEKFNFKKNAGEASRRLSLYGAKTIRRLSEAAENHKKRILKTFREIVDLLLSVLGNPEGMGVRVVFGEWTFESGHFSESSFIKHYGMRGNNKEYGLLEISYSGDEASCLSFFSENNERLFQKIASLIAGLYESNEWIVRGRGEWMGMESSPRAFPNDRSKNWEWELTGNRLAYSEEAKEILGLAPAAAGKEPEAFSRLNAFLEKVHPDDREIVETRIYAAVYDGVPYRVEYRIHPSPGVERHIRDEVEIYFGEDGRPVRLAGLIRDVTDIKKTEKELRDSEALYQSLVENLPQNIFRKDMKGRFTFANRNFCSALGRSLDEIVGKTDYDFYPPSLAEKYSRDDRRVIECGGTFETVEENQNPGGETTYVQVVKTPIYNAVGETIGVQGIFWDVSEKRRVEETLARGKEEWEQTFDSVPDLIAIIDEEQNILRVNMALADRLGLPPKEVIGRKCYDLLHQTGQPPSHCPQSGLKSAERKCSMDVHEERLRGDFHFIAAGLLDKSGRQIGSVHILREITERLKLEEQLRQSQKMEAIGRLAGGITHDFNNLLTVINGYSELLILGMDKNHPMRRYIHEINKAGMHAASLTKQLLAFSRKQKFKMEIINLNHIVADMESIIRRLIGSDIQMNFYLDSQLGYMKADPGQIEQVVLNLAINAKDAMPNGGKLSFETSNVNLDELFVSQHIDMKPGSYVMLAVSDTGCGMSKETASRIFEPFFTTKEPGKGTGLGLSTVFGIVKQSDGAIWVYSEPGRGATFKIYFPQAEAIGVKPMSQRKTSSINLYGNETVLLVEDIDFVRTLVRSILLRYGYAVLDVSDAAEALTAIENYDGRIQILITDVEMPAMTGLDLAERLKASLPDLKIVYMSGHTANDIYNNHHLDPAAHFLQKPFTPIDLVGKIREALDEPPPTAE